MLPVSVLPSSTACAPSSKGLVKAGLPRLLALGASGSGYLMKSRGSGRSLCLVGMSKAHYPGSLYTPLCHVLGKVSRCTPLAQGPVEKGKEK